MTQYPEPVAAFEKILSVFEQGTYPHGFLLGVTGAPGAGKTTFSLQLEAWVRKTRPTLKVSVIATDCFIYPNQYLQTQGLMERKGFPESFDMTHMQQTMQALLSGSTITLPVYSQMLKDIDPVNTMQIERSDIYIFEGVSVFFRYETFSLIDILDYCVYLEVDLEIIKERAMTRFLEAFQQAKQIPTPYFESLIHYSDEEIKKYAEALWLTNDVQLFKQHIAPYRHLAPLCFHQ